MTLFDVTQVSSKGGSIRGFAQPLSTGRRPKTKRLLAMVAEEERRGITRPEIYREYYKAIEQRKQATLGYLSRAKADGKKIAAYGASTTTTTLLYHFELGTYVDFIADDNPIKHYLYSPGFHIPVLPSSELYVRKPDIVVILAWIYAEPIIRRHEKFTQQGGKFLIPLPDLKIV